RRDTDEMLGGLAHNGFHLGPNQGAAKHRHGALSTDDGRNPEFLVRIPRVPKADQTCRRISIGYFRSKYIASIEKRGCTRYECSHETAAAPIVSHFHSPRHVFLWEGRDTVDFNQRISWKSGHGN